ncbi:Gfo/Idh/MocA family oxidoreductase [Parvularcula sp. IMCC14364]|uniref:Gfo/Idh/MocA family oxidoreductase n=1 Tax=Parvularcula sp. IMCC14364 TaxID=3067902 RepID=UPI0027424D0F|nr:Gfo/Idh/MocA family oxidoreductase [Parvularcula sp. IMCC14364]
MKQVALIGTGNIAQTHAQALQSLDNVQLAAVMDVNGAAAETFADKFGIRQTHADMASLLASTVDVVHVLTPPATHFAVAQEVLNAGKSVFLEKPMAETVAECQQLQALAAENDVSLRINQNYVFTPAHQKLRKALEENRIGPVRSVQCDYVVPLRQLAARQFGHWMFDSPLNLLLEQAVHPVSLVDDVLGTLDVETVWHGPAQEYAPGIFLVTEWIVVLRAGSVPVQLHLKLGADHPDWRLSLMGDDGWIEADYMRDTTRVQQAGAYIEFAENLRSNLADSASLTGQGLMASGKYLAAQAGLLGRSDSFYVSIRNSIEQFYTDLGEAADNLDGAQGMRVVEVCEKIAVKTALPEKAISAAPPMAGAKNPSVLVLGGTGFIGSALVRKLTEQGEVVRVIARNTANLPSHFNGDNVEIVKGSISDAATLASAMAGVPSVVNLAHGGGGDSWEAIRAALVGGARTVAEAAQGAGVERLLHVGSIAALYLGDAQTTIRHDTPVDPLREERADYSRAKAEADLMLLELYKEQGVPVSIFRPGVVLGQGTSPFHSGIGFYNRDRVCLGWNDGTNPLPLILVEDVAEALRLGVMEVPAAALAGQCFNLVGDVRLSARDYTSELAGATGRPLVYRPQSLWQQQAAEVSKWAIKQVGGRKVAFPSMRDLRSRGLVSPFDISIEKTTLNWQPVSDRTVFIDQAIRIHGSA